VETKHIFIFLPLQGGVAGNATAASGKLARISQGSRREAPPNGIACKAREGFQRERDADIP
jgi:hypothetical protein